MGSWSIQLADHYALSIPSDWAAWLDAEIWSTAGGAEFAVPVRPQELLQADNDFMWGGFLPPNMLPIIGNDYGDWLAAVVDHDGTVSDVVYWSHGGGDWLSYGSSLAEALLFDAYYFFRYGQREHQVGANRPVAEVYAYADWARQQLQAAGMDVPAFWQESGSADRESVLSLLEDAGICRVAVARERLLRALSHGLHQHAQPKLAAELNWHWNPDFVRGLFDFDLLSAGQRSDLAKAIQGTVGAPSDFERQDWERAEEIALRVSSIAPQSGWAWDIAAWSAERRGETSLAVQRYLAGLNCSVYSSDSVNFCSHWYPDAAGKFAAHRLIELGSDAGELGGYLNCFRGNDERTMRTQVANYWRKIAEEREAAGDGIEAYRAFWKSGWDVGLLDLPAYSVILSDLERVAEMARSPSLARLATLHRHCCLTL